MRLGLVAVLVAAVSAVTTLQAGPTVFPTGTTIYDPAKAWSGYTVFVLPNTGAVLIDMNGRLVREWQNFEGASGGPTRVLPGGFVMGALGSGRPNQESLAVGLFDWADKPLWRFDRSEQIQRGTAPQQWSARQHHDWQRDDFPAGYYSPEASPRTTGARTLVLAHTNLNNPAIHDERLEDDRLIEVDETGTIVWEWFANQHIDELGFSPAARAGIRRAPFNKARGSVDWLHLNSATYVGPNRWFDAGDQRFRPDHVIVSSREANIVAIIARDGKVVWRIGPDYRESDALRAIGQVIGQHHAHLVPKGLPGAGNLLVFNNGGAAGYGEPTPAAPNGVGIVSRPGSRILEIDPVALKKVWEYGFPGNEGYKFFSGFISGAQRLPNGNTLITEGADGRLFEVTPAREIVWEYVSPYVADGPNPSNRVYRAYRLPYSWVPQVEKPVERAVVPAKNTEFRVAASAQSAGALAGAQPSGTLPADLDPTSRARLPYLRRANLDEASQKIYDTLPGRNADGTLRGPLAFAAYSPAVAKALFDLHNAAVAGVLDPHVRELAILVASRETNYSLEWNGHEPAAIKAGVSPKTIDVVRRNADVTGLDERDAAVIRFGRQMLRDNTMDSATFAAAAKLFGQRGAMDLVAVMSTYAVSGFYATAVDEHMPAGRPDLNRPSRP